MATDVLAGRYELGAPLGSGGMARVVEGYDRLLQRRVAIKLLRDDLRLPGLRARFLHEARAAASFSHPNAVAVYDTGTNGAPYIVMELVDGRSLADELAAHGALDPQRAVSIAEQVLAALGAAHRRGLVHRDVKPANILLPADGGVKLTDFGIAKSILEGATDLTQTGQLLGTPRYLSPEQVEGRRATPRSDLYALGVVLYEMLAGTPLFDRPTPIAVALAHQEDEPPPLDRRRGDLRPALVTAVHRALEKDPERRFADAAQMQAALAGHRPGATAAAATVALPRREDETVVLTSPPATGQAGRRGGDARGRPRWWIAGLVAALAALALFAVTLTGRDTAGEPEQAADQPDAVPAEDAEPDPPPDPEPPAASPQEPPQPVEPPQAQPPEDFAAFIGWLAEDPGRGGEKGSDLLDGLLKVARERGGKQRDEAEKTAEKAEEWMGKGELDPQVGAMALRLLEPLRLPPGQRDDPSEGGDDGA
jgi:eukaryotic-like serine/threonine-protein kinase